MCAEASLHIQQSKDSQFHCAVSGSRHCLAVAAPAAANRATSAAPCSRSALPRSPSESRPPASIAKGHPAAPTRKQPMAVTALAAAAFGLSLQDWSKRWVPTDLPRLAAVHHNQHLAAIVAMAGLIRFLRLLQDPARPSRPAMSVSKPATAPPPLLPLPPSCLKPLPCSPVAPQSGSWQRSCSVHQSSRIWRAAAGTSGHAGKAATEVDSACCMPTAVLHVLHGSSRRVNRTAVVWQPTGS